jgi:CRISPR-associated endoribonuclease Cas6
MRFFAEIVLNGDKPIIPSDYRRNILSLIKEAINSNQSGTEIYEKYFIKEAGKIRPFTFSVSFKADEAQNRKGIIRLVEPWIKLHFSASDSVLLKYAYDGFVQLQKDYPLFPQLKATIGPFHCPECLLLRCTSCRLKVTIGHVDLEPEKMLHDNELLFKTCSPIIVRDTNESGKSSGYVTADSPVFEEKLYHCVKSMCKVLLDDVPELARKAFSTEFINLKKCG